MTWTNLHEACENGRPENVIEAAQKHPEEVLSVDDHGSTPMHLLVWRNPDPLVVKALLEACPQAASAMDYHGDLPLHVAVSRPGIRMGVIQLLMPAYPTATSITNREGLTPLHMALRHAPSNEDIIRLLVEDYPFALTKPIKMGDPAPLKLITRNTKHHVVLDPSGGMTKDATELHYDCLSAQTRDGAYPLHIAIQANAPHTVLELLIKEAPEVLRFPNKFGETPLHLSLKKGPKAPEEEIELLLKSEPLVLYVHDAQGNLPIHIAASHGCTVNVTKRLVDLWPESTSEVNKAGSNAMACGRNAECDEEVLGLLAITDRIPHGFE